MILLPTTNGKQLLTIMGKEDEIYLLDSSNLGKYCIIQTPACTNSNPQIVQEIPGALTGLWGTPAYWNGNLYWGGGNGDTGQAEPIKAYSFNAGGSGKISTSATCAAGANCQALYAYDATNLRTLLYSSLSAPNNRDLLGQAIKFVTPTIANGKVYVPSGGAVSAFGLLNEASPAATVPTITPGFRTYTSAQSVTLADTTPNATIYYTVDGSTATTASAKYTDPVKLAASATVKAFAAAANVYGIGKNGALPTAGGLDTFGYSLSGTLLGSSVTWAGVTFNIGAAGAANAVSSATITLAAGTYSTLNLLAVGVNGGQVGQTFVVTYTDGTTTTITQSISDWFSPQNYAGESRAATMNRVISPTGASRAVSYYVYGYSFTLNAAKTVKSVTLPANRNVVVVAGALVNP